MEEALTHALVASESAWEIERICPKRVERVKVSALLNENKLIIFHCPANASVSG